MALPRFVGARCKVLKLGFVVYAPIILWRDLAGVRYRLG